VRALAKELNNQNIHFKVPDKLTSKDSRIINAQKALTEKKHYLDRGLTSAGRGNLSINVSPQNVNRALCFMHKCFFNQFCCSSDWLDQPKHIPTQVIPAVFAGS
jgi:hypothetical protein